MPGIDFITATVNQRRPDPAINERFYTGNFSNGYYDAGRVSLVAPRWHGAAISASYWLSKAIDLEGDYFTTGAGSERWPAVGPTEFNARGELKGLSSFDQPHALNSGSDGPGLGNMDGFPATAHSSSTPPSSGARSGIPPRRSGFFPGPRFAS